MAENYDFDVLVIGAGPGGYVAAIRAAQLGLKTACAESRETLGGTCLNVGCIPSKALLHASELFEEAHARHARQMGHQAGKVELDLDTMHGGRKEAVKGLTQGIEFLFKKNKVEWLKGLATFESADTVKVGDRTVRAKNIVIATGSSVTPLPGVDHRPGADRRFHRRARAAEGAQAHGRHRRRRDRARARLGVAAAWRPGHGRRVPRPDPARLRRRRPQGSQQDLQEAGLRVQASTKVTKAERKGDTVTLTVEPAAGGAAETVEADVVLVSIGRRPNTEGLGLDKAGLKTNQRGQIETSNT